MPRHRLTDEQWDAISDLFPPPAWTGRPPADRRMIVDAICWILRTGSPWRDLPEVYGSPKTAWKWFDQWNRDGTWDEVLRRLQAMFIDAGEIDDQLWCVDGSVVRAARCAGGAVKKGAQTSRKTTH